MERPRLGFMKKEQKPLTPQKITEKRKVSNKTSKYTTHNHQMIYKKYKLAISTHK